MGQIPPHIAGQYRRARRKCRRALANWNHCTNRGEPRRPRVPWKWARVYRRWHDRMHAIPQYRIGGGNP